MYRRTGHNMTQFVTVTTQSDKAVMAMVILLQYVSHSPHTTRASFVAHLVWICLYLLAVNNSW